MSKINNISGKILFFIFISIAAVSLAYTLAVDAKSQQISNGDPQNPSLFEKRFQSNQIIANFAVNPNIALQWVPPSFNLVLDAQGMATGIVALIHSADYCFISTPNSPPLEEGKNVAPDSVVHFWFLVQGAYEYLPVPGAMMTNPTAYYYDAVDLVTNQDAYSLYRRAGRPAVLVRDITFTDQLTDDGLEQMVEITFRNGRKMFVEAYTQVAALLPGTIIVGGNAWQYHVGGNGKMGNGSGISFDPFTENPGNLSSTKVQYLGKLAALPNSTQIEIYASGTIFEDYFGMSDVATSGTLLMPNNIVLNASRGDLLWTDYPSPEIPVPPALPEP